MMSDKIAPIVNYCLLNSCTDMYGCRGETALALLFVCQGNTKLEKKAKRIFEQELSKALHEDIQTALLHMGLLISEGILDHCHINTMSQYVQEIHDVLRTTKIQQGMEDKWLYRLLIYFMILPLYGAKIEEEECLLLDNIGKHLHDRNMASGMFLSDALTRLCLMYLIASRMNADTVSKKWRTMSCTYIMRVR